MLSPPTDRLFKFFAVSGVALLLAGPTLSYQAFHEAELQKIEATSKAHEGHYTYQRYASKVNEMIALNNRAITSPASASSAQEFAASIRALMPEAEKLARESEEVMVQTRRQLALAQHYERRMHASIAVGVASSIAGLVLAFIGFRVWIRSAKNEA